MGKGLIFFVCTCIILVLTIINLGIAPIVNKKVGYFWGTLNCARLKDIYDDQKEDYILSSQAKKSFEVQINECQRVKAMHNMEYTSLIFNMIFGFVCGLLGFLHLFDAKKDFIPITGLISLCCGIVGFVLTFVYVIYNGFVFTGNYSSEIKTNSKGAFAERIEGTNNYKCLYYDESGNIFSVYAKYSELNKKQYNYDKDLHKSYQSDEYSYCQASYYNGNNLIEECSYEEQIILSQNYPDPDNVGFYIPCKYLYASEQSGIYNKDIFGRFFAALFFSLIICLANVCLAFLGFMIYSSPDDF